MYCCSMCPPLQHVARNVAEVELSATSATLRATNYIVLAHASQLQAISFMGGHTLQQNCWQCCTQCCTVCPHCRSRWLLPGVRLIILYKYKRFQSIVVEPLLFTATSHQSTSVLTLSARAFCHSQQLNFSPYVLCHFATCDISRDFNGEIIMCANQLCMISM